MIKGIFFDAAGIFYRREEPVMHYAQQLVRGLGLSAETSADDAARLEELKEQAADGWISAQTYWDEFLKMRAVADPAKRAELLSKILQQANKVVGQPGARETVKTLKERGFILGIITSTMYPLEWKMAWLKTAGVAEFMDVIASSATLRARKPHPSIYWVALNQAGLTAREAAFVGEGAKELGGARRVGMVTVAALYNSDAEADYYARTLPDLLNVPVFQR